MSGVNVLRDKKGSLSKKDSRLINSPKEEENDRWPSCNLFVLIPAYKKSKLNERKILVVRSLFYSSLEFCTMIERWHVTEISTSDFTHHSVHSSCVHSLDHAGKDTLIYCDLCWSVCLSSTSGQNVKWRENNCFQTHLLMEFIPSNRLENTAKRLKRNEVHCFGDNLHKNSHQTASADRKSTKHAQYGQWASFYTSTWTNTSSSHPQFCWIQSTFQRDSNCNRGK